MRKYWKIGLAILPAVVAIAGLAACEDGGKEHSHTYSSAWTSDETDHWHAANCDHTEEIGDKAPHSFSEDFSYDGTSHWYACSVCARKKDEARHELIDGACACGYSDPAVRLVYTLTDPTTYAVSLNKAALEDKSFTSVQIPEKYKGHKVKIIAENAFNGAKYLKEISLPKTIVSIGDYAFQGCASLTKVVIPDTIKTLGNQAFNGCKSLETFKMPASITEVGENLFLNCEKLQNIEFAEGTTRIGTQAFANCKSLTSVTVPETVTYIGLKAFKGTGLKEITVPAAVTTLFSYAFQDCTALTKAELLCNIEYTTGGWFKGCTALQTLTLPFVGQDIHPLSVSRTALGFAFGTEKYGAAESVAAVEQNGVTYYIPESLTSLTVLGGYIKEGAFDNCSMLRSVTLKNGVVAEADAFKNCNADFIVEAAPTVTNVKLTLDGASTGTAEVGDTLTFSYEASKFARVSLTVSKNGTEAQASDYSYVEQQGGGTFTFNTVGSFAITVKAANGEKVASATVEVIVSLESPELSEIELGVASQEIEDDASTAATTISYTVDSESAVSVSVKKDGSAIDGAYDETTKTVTVTGSGVYTIEVTAVRNEITVTKTATFIVSLSGAAKPEISFGAGSATVAEGDASALTVNVNYGTASKGSETYEFYVKNGAKYENADTNDYVWNEATKEFTPKVAGEYQIKLTAISSEGGSESATVTVTATAQEIGLSLTESKTYGWVRALTSGSNEIAYGVEGYSYGYNVTYEKDYSDALIGGADGEKVTVSLGTPNTVTFKLIYTHRTDASKKYELEIPVSFVSDEGAPVLGEDPFAGTHGTLIPSTGLMLYYDVKDIAAENVTFEVADTSKLKDLKEGGNVSVAKLGGLDNGWYVLIEDFDGNNNKANGEISLKLTATVDGKTAAATKVFKVTAVGTNDTANVTEYMKAVLGDTFQQNVQFLGSADIRQNMILSKTGIVHNRANYDLGSKDALRFDMNGIAGNANTQTFRADFKFTSLKGNNMELTFGFRTGTWNGWAGSIGFRPNWDGGANKANEMQAQGWLKNPNDQDQSGTFEKDEGKVPTVGAGTVFYGRVERTLDDSNNVIYTAYWSEDGETYKQLCQYNVGTSDTDGRAAKYVYALQLGFGGNSGYYLENLKITNLGA